jgi:predicted RecA/RadA family phage recombinase
MKVEKFKISGYFKAEVIRDGEVVDTREGHNTVTTEGQNSILDVMFHSATQITAWFIGLINNTPSPTLLSADTLAAHTGWAELVPGTDYTGNRLAWNVAAASAGSNTSSSVTTFPILTTQTVFGILVASVASGTSGKLWATGAFDTPIPVVNGDQLKITYQVVTTAV